MAIMKRIIYRNYLLPPCVSRITTLNTFIRSMHPEKYPSQIRVQISNMTPQLKARWRNQMKEYNKHVTTEREAYHQQYLQKIKHLPFYYDQLFRGNQNLEKSIKWKKTLFDRCQQAHNEFMNENRWQNVFRIPILFFGSGREVFQCQNEGQDWQQLSQSVQQSYNKMYERDKTEYYHKLYYISFKVDMSLRRLMTLMKNQLNDDQSFI